MRRAALIITLVLATVLGGITGLRLAGPSTHTTQLGDIQLDLALATAERRGLEVYVPLADWGLRARVTAAPLRFVAEPRGIDRAGVARTVAAGPAEPTVRQVRSELGDAFEDAAVRTGLITLAGTVAGGLLAALTWHALGVRGRRLLLAPVLATGLGALLIGGLTAWVSATWDADRLERPRYYASGAELQRILAQADALRRTGERYSDQVDTSIRAIAGLLADSEVPGVESTHRILLASDIHNNVLPLPTLRRFAEGHPAVLAGDFTINGSRVEVPMLRGLTTVGDPTFAVSGNHDSPGVMKALAAGGAEVLTHEGAQQPDGSITPPAIRDIDGLSLAGFEDPLRYRFPDFPSGVRIALSYRNMPNGEARFRADVADQWRWWQALPARPDVLVVHQEDIAEALANLIWAAQPDGAPLTIMTGHTHNQALHRYGPVTIVNSGTAGAGGIFGTGRNAVGLALLDFAEDGRLEAADFVQTDPTTTAASARRVIVAQPDCDEELVFCHEAPVAPDLS